MREETTTIEWSKFKITNVPVMVDEFGERYYKSSISIIISALRDLMVEDKIPHHVNFEDFKDIEF